MAVRQFFFLPLSSTSFCKSSKHYSLMPTFTPDDSQKKIISLHSGHHLVLAPPGCGKTQILTERIRFAHNELGVSYGDMLCLTFTNRAARGMMERISQNIEDKSASDIFVGNVHRYCIRFLTTEGVIPANSAIIDDEDAISIMAQMMNVDEVFLASDWTKRRECFDAIHLSHMMHQIRTSAPRHLRLHPDCLTSDEVKIMQALCEIHRVAFTPQAMIDLYENATHYIDSINGSQTYEPIIARIGRENIIRLLRKLNMAHGFEAYKRARMLVDFNDILILTYDSLANATASDDEEKVAMLARWQRHWVQIDEVQDLNPLQMAIIDLLIAKENPTIIYLGDEQQAIFSFMGAKLSTLNMLRERCLGSTHFLANNHRSPRYLLDIYNTYAEKVLNISPDVLPHATNEVENNQCTLLLTSQTPDTEYRDVAMLSQRLCNENPTETTAIVVASNADADNISKELESISMPHFKISGTDLFSTPDMKLLLAHFQAVMSDTNPLAWARILQGTKAVHTAFGARDFVHQMVQNAVAPCELLSLSEDDHTVYTQQFARAYEEKEIVIFDTETTGLNTFKDDIIQIAAMKVRGREVLGSFMCHIETEKEIPAMLGNIVNPIIAERQTAQILSHQDALRQFAEFIGDAVLLAHNADFDIHILESNLQRYAPDIYSGEGKGMPVCFDSLRLVRLLEPSLRVYKLKYLLEVLGLEGNNSHLADDDVFATKSLVDHLYAKAKEIEPHQQALLSQDSFMRVVQKLHQNYVPLYLHTKQLLWQAEKSLHLADEMEYIHDALLQDNIIYKVEKLHYVMDYLRQNLISETEYPALAQQLQRYMAEINTLKEADLCESSRIKERIYVSTVHKAKGLEFDNVIVFDAVEGRYPGFNSKKPEAIQEDARKLYVALSRAKKRLVLAVSEQFVSRNHTVYPREVSRFLKPVLGFFTGI